VEPRRWDAPIGLGCLHVFTLFSLLDLLLPGYPQSRVGAPDGSHSKSASKVIAVLFPNPCSLKLPRTRWSALR
jgi:hypothetical protein